MKQKNVILVAVAVGCGLVAAILTSRMSASPAVVEQVEVPVAAKDLPVGTKLTKAELKNLVGYKKFAKDALPPAFAGTEDELGDKLLTRTVRAGETFNPQDLTTNVVISPPPGMNMVTFAATPEKGVAGFAGPGSKVDLVCSVQQKTTNRAVVFPLLTDMLVLAIDTNQQYAKDGAFPNMSMVSLAVTTKQSLLLHGAINRGGDIRLVLRHPEKPAVWEHPPTDDEIWAILSDEPKKLGNDRPDAPAEGKKAVVVKLPVPTEDLPAGTEITAELLSTKFKDVDFTPPAPANIVQNLKEHTGKFLLHDVSANQFLPKSYLGDKKPVEVIPAPEPKKAETKPAPQGPPPVFWDTTVHTSNGYRKYRYQKLPGGEHKFLGEVQDDGSVVPAKPPGQDADPKAEDKKPAGDDKPAEDVKPKSGKKPGPVI
jgi:Flp pilus assembly protein CpaB